MSVERTQQHLRELMRKNLAAHEEKRRHDKIKRASFGVDDHGRLIRGYVTRVRCLNCSAQKWDDGRPCSGCGHLRFEDLNAEDARRLD